MRRKSKRWLILPVIGMLLLSACGTTKIRKILNEPTRYHNREVEVEGTVTSSYGAFVAGAYQVDDGTGKIYVIAAGPVPRKGSRVKVEGMVTSGVTFGGQSFGTTIRERHHRVR